MELEHHVITHHCHSDLFAYLRNQALGLPSKIM
jgi:hypothetical protein